MQRLGAMAIAAGAEVLNTGRPIQAQGYKRSTHSKVTGRRSPVESFICATTNLSFSPIFWLLLGFSVANVGTDAVCSRQFTSSYMMHEYMLHHLLRMGVLYCTRLLVSPFCIWHSRPTQRNHLQPAINYMYTGTATAAAAKAVQQAQGGSNSSGYGTAAQRWWWASGQTKLSALMCAHQQAMACCHVLPNHTLAGSFGSKPNQAATAKQQHWPIKMIWIEALRSSKGSWETWLCWGSGQHY